MDGELPPGVREVGDSPCRIICGTGDGIPYLVPEIVLLFEAKHSALAKNRADFGAVAPLLDDGAVDWLRWALSRIRPGHPWIGATGGARA
jgi:hypothetical protein